MEIFQNHSKTISPENKKQKSVLDYVDCSKEELTSNTAEMLESQALCSSQNFREKSAIEAKLDKILEKIKPINDIREDMKTLKDSLLRLEKTAEKHESRILDIEKNAEVNDKTLQAIQSHINRLDIESKERNSKYDTNSLWKTKCDLLESLSKMEVYSRKENIIFEGLHGTEVENCQEVIYKLLVERLLIQDARERIHFTAVHRIGKRKIPTYATLRLRHVITRVSVYAHKEEIMSHRKLLLSQTEGHVAV